MPALKPARRLPHALLAGGLAVALFSAGAGTFATWTSQTSLPATEVVSGELAVSAGTGTWTTQDGRTLADPAGYVMAPGTTVTYRAPVTLTVRGTDLAAVVRAEFAGLTEPAKNGTRMELATI